MTEVLAFDCETTGVDLRHGARPFLVTTCAEDGIPVWWEWFVDPLTRLPEIPVGELEEIAATVGGAGLLAAHGAKFDITALGSIGLWSLLDVETVWPDVRCTLLAAHLLGSNQPKDLSNLCMQWLGRDIKPLEDALQTAVEACRAYCRKSLPAWKIAVSRKQGGTLGLAGERLIPSAEKEVWRNDYWLPRALAKHLGLPDDHGWWQVASRYANADSANGWLLWLALWSEIERRGLEALYFERLALLPAYFEMEARGVTGSLAATDRIEVSHRAEAADLAATCEWLAARHVGRCGDCGGSGWVKLVPCRACSGKGSGPYRLKLPKSGNNDSLRNFVFGPLGLTPHRPTPTGLPALDKNDFERWELELPPGDPLDFITALSRLRRKQTGLGYIDAYRWFALPQSDGGDTFVIHCHFNPTGTDCTRSSSSSVNMQQVSRQSEANQRACFGPAPGREWWSADGMNLELRIPAYESEEQELIALYEEPDRPPFYGSEHMLVFSTIFPEIWEAELRDVGIEKVGPHIKEKYESTNYRWTKGGDFACVPMSTMALCRSGWKSYDQISVGDEVLGYDCGFLKWTMVLKKVKFSSAKLTKINNEHFQAVTTPDHRWLGKRRTGRGRTRRFVDEFCTTDTIKHESTLYLSAPVKDCPKLDLTDTEAAIIGFAHSDGSVTKSKKGGGPSRGLNQEKVGFRVRIYQSKPKGRKYIRKLLKQWGKPFTEYSKGGKDKEMRIWSLPADECGQLWKRAGLWDEQDFEKFVLNLGPSQRNAFVDAVFEAEGCWDNRGNTRLFTQNEGRFANGIILALFLIGRYPTIVKKKNYYGTKSVCLSIRASKPHVTGQRITRKSLKGVHDVWCIQTGLGTWVMKQNNSVMLTGNCQYGAVLKDVSGTADIAFHKQGAHALLLSRFSLKEELNQRYIRFARVNGFVETLPDRTVDPNHGYPLLTTRTEWGDVLPTVPLSYHIQGSAGWWKSRGMTRCAEVLRQWRREGFDAWMILDVHDELVFDFPKGPDPRVDPSHSNLGRARELARLMQRAGPDLIPSIPTPVSLEYHDVSWAKKHAFKVV